MLLLLPTHCFPKFVSSACISEHIAPFLTAVTRREYRVRTSMSSCSQNSPSEAWGLSHWPWPAFHLADMQLLSQTWFLCCSWGTSRQLHCIWSTYVRGEQTAAALGDLVSLSLVSFTLLPCVHQFLHVPESCSVPKSLHHIYIFFHAATPYLLTSRSIKPYHKNISACMMHAENSFHWD